MSGCFEDFFNDLVDMSNVCCIDDASLAFVSNFVVVASSEKGYWKRNVCFVVQTETGYHLTLEKNFI